MMRVQPLMTAAVWCVAASLSVAPALAQQKVPPQPPKPGTQRPAPAKPARTPAEPVRLRAFGSVGWITFQARDSFDTVLDSHGGLLYGGGGQITLPFGLYAEVAAMQFRADGERVFIGPNREVFPLGIPVEVTVTPLEITGGWRYRGRGRRGPWPVVPYVGGGLSAYKYRETSEFADGDEDVDEWHNGFHILGGVEYRVRRWLGVAGEVAFSSIPDALGEGGVSAAFNEDNLGGTSVRLKVIVGR